MSGEIIPTNSTQPAQNPIPDACRWEQNPGLVCPATQARLEKKAHIRNTALKTPQ